MLALSKCMSSPAESPKYTVTHRAKQTTKAISKAYARRARKMPNTYCGYGNFQMKPVRTPEGLFKKKRSGVQ